MTVTQIDISGFISRDRYISQIEQYIDKPLIKVLIGMRRVGKSVIMRLLIDRLLKRGIPLKNILYINKESLEFDHIKNYTDLYKHTIAFFANTNSGKRYIFIDEVQEIELWEKAVVSFLSDGVCDIILSGSNSNLLSSELATLLSGRYVEILIHPLNFKEFLRFRGDYSDREEEFKNYLKYGGLPGLHLLPLKDDAQFTYLNSILNTVLFKDIISRYSVREPAILDRLVKYLFDNIGNITTAKRITDYFKSMGIRVSVDTILNYIDFLIYGFVIEKVSRYDIKGKRLLEFNHKVFLNDVGLRNGLIGYREKDLNGILENLVFKELQCRGYRVYIGVLDNLEIDFIAEKQGRKIYLQVCYTLSSEDVVKREFGNLMKIRDNYEKIVVSMDKFFPPDIDGIKHRYLIDFLLEDH